MIVNHAGKMVKQQWQELICWFDNIKLHEFIAMPDHFHGIVEFLEWGNHKGLPLHLGRVNPGLPTRVHRLHGVVERHVIAV